MLPLSSFQWYLGNTSRLGLHLKRHNELASCATTDLINGRKRLPNYYWGIATDFIQLSLNLTQVWTSLWVGCSSAWQIKKERAVTVIGVEVGVGIHRHFYIRSVSTNSLKHKKCSCTLQLQNYLKCKTKVFFGGHRIPRDWNTDIWIVWHCTGKFSSDSLELPENERFEATDCGKGGTTCYWAFSFSKWEKPLGNGRFICNTRTS